VDICDTVDFFYRKGHDSSNRRAKCANWGVVYDETKPQPAPAATTQTTSPSK
jgi:hypothetical protein